MGATEQKSVLIIEDDPHTAELVAMYLTRDGFEAKTAPDGEKALEMAASHPPDFVILDLMIPKIDGWEVFRRLRRQSDVPVIMLTARGEEIDRVSGLTMGADDYVSKPFSPRELVARVRAVLRRTAEKEGNRKAVFSHGPLSLDPDQRRVRVHGNPIHLTRHEYVLLETLMRTPGRIFTRDELLEKLYPAGEGIVVDRVVDVHVGKLRQKIEQDPSNPRYILTARGLGYRFADPQAEGAGAGR